MLIDIDIKENNILCNIRKKIKIKNFIMQFKANIAYLYCIYYFYLKIFNITTNIIQIYKQFSLSLSPTLLFPLILWFTFERMRNNKDFNPIR